MRNVVRSLSLMALSFGVSIVLSLSQESFAQDVSAQNQSSQNAGAVFVMANDVSHNQVISYARAADGSLLETGNFATGGRGTGGTTDPLESQGSLVLSQRPFSFFWQLTAAVGKFLLSMYGVQIFFLPTESSPAGASQTLLHSGDLLFMFSMSAAAATLSDSD